MVQLINPAQIFKKKDELNLSVNLNQTQKVQKVFKNPMDTRFIKQSPNPPFTIKK